MKRVCLPAAGHLVVLVATANRAELLGSRCFPSIINQTQSFDRLVLVDDSDDADQSRQVEALVHQQTIAIDLLCNRRTRGAAGAWNTGIDHIARQFSDPSAVHVAIIDDDDAWEPDYLEKAISALQCGAEVVASAFQRIVDHDPLRLVIPPAELTAEPFIVGNPGIQASNLIVRLDRLLEAGGFDEALRSCTDRDLCIRLARTCGGAYSRIENATVRHYACSNRPRISTPLSPARMNGLDAFFAKYQPQMSLQQRVDFERRALSYFGWAPSSAANANGNVAPMAERSSEAVQGGIQLVVGLIADDRRVESVGGLLEDLLQLQDEPGLAGLDVLILENGTDRSASSNLAQLVASVRQQGLRVHLIDRESQRDAATDGDLASGHYEDIERLSIGPARTALQTYLYHFAMARPGSVVWIIDDDMRLTPLIEGADGHQRCRIPLAAQLQILRQQDVAIAIGRYTGAAPLPAMSTVRVQLVDLLASLRWLMVLDADAALPDTSGHNREMRRDRRDYYYDLSHHETDRLETPFLLEPAFAGETVAQASARLCACADRILAGEQVFRPLLLDAHECAAMHSDPDLNRGGNTFVFDIQALRDAPNAVPEIAGRPTRRSDMIWALLQRAQFGRTVVTVPIGVYHDRSGLPSPVVLDEQSIADDIRGFALFSALKDDLLDGCPGIGERSEKYLEERLAAFRLSFHRIRGLARELEQLARSAPSGLPYPQFWDDFAKRILCLYAIDVLVRIEQQVRLLTACQVHDFKTRLPEVITDHQNRLAETRVINIQLQKQRIANAHSAVDALDIQHGSLRVLGHGCEGVVLADASSVFKVFDLWTPQDSARAQSVLRRLIGRWADARSLYPLQAWKAIGHQHVLIYPYQDSQPYTGGNGPGLVDLLVECHRHGLICRNIHPKNLRVVDRVVRLIDYGRDLYVSEEVADFKVEFVAMCRRAFLSWRWWHRNDLDGLLHKSIRDHDLPELEGFEYFLSAVYQVLGLSVPMDPVEARAVELRPGRVLDYGCGKAKLALRLAALGAEVVAYDPDPNLRAQLNSRAGTGFNPVFTADAACAVGPYDLIVCRRVACLLEDAQLEALLADLRHSVAPTGRVLFALCHPVYAPRCVTPEATPLNPHDGDSERTFLWEKLHLHTGRRLGEIHRPERQLRRLLGRAGFRIVERAERRSIDMERFEPIADLLMFELEPVELPMVSLLIKACAMDARNLAVHVRHLVSQLEQPRVFKEVLLTLDAKMDNFLRQHGLSDYACLLREAEVLRNEGWIDRIVIGPSPGDAAAALNTHWLGHDCTDTHAINGAQLSSTLAGFEACATRYLLHADVDVMIGRHDSSHDYLQEMLESLRGDLMAVTTAFNIAQDNNRPYTSDSTAGPWRTESRIGLVDLVRMRALLPLPSALSKNDPPMPWHRALDLAVAQGQCNSLRGGDRRTFFVHPPNSRKQDARLWFQVLWQIEVGQIPDSQVGEVDWVGEGMDWLTPRRFEPFVFIIAGRNVAPGRFRRCLESILRQRRDDWGAIVIDDASTPAWAEEVALLCQPHAQRITFLHNRMRMGLLANMTQAIRHHCGNPATVIITLDADDCLIGDQVLDTVCAQYNDGADVTVGTMLRTDKQCDYPVSFATPRNCRGGNVWQHLRTFRKRLFDAIPDAQLRQDGCYIDLSTDWAFMLPIVEIASQPRHIQTPLYLHEPSGRRDAENKIAREAVIARLVALPPLARQTEPSTSGVT